jgi:hypothetical protein
MAATRFIPCSADAPVSQSISRSRRSKVGDQEVSAGPDPVPTTGNIVPPRQAASLWIAEYRALRDETIERIKIQHQLIIAALVAPGTVIAIGRQLNDPSLILLYPFFGMLLCTSWAHQDFRKRRIGQYIRQHIENAAKAGPTNIGWEHDLTQGFDYPRFLYLSTRGIFLGTELLAFVEGLAEARLFDWVPATLSAMFTGAPLPFDLSHMTVQGLLLGLIGHLRLVLLILLAVASIITTNILLHQVVTLLKRARNIDNREKKGCRARRRSNRRRGGSVISPASQPYDTDQRSSTSSPVSAHIPATD